MTKQAIKAIDEFVGAYIHPNDEVQAKKELKRIVKNECNATKAQMRARVMKA